MKSDVNLLEALKLSNSLSYMLKQNIGHVARIRELEAEAKEIAEAIHYPECWDTTAYPALYDAIHNIGCNPEHCTKKKEDLD